MHAKAKFQKKIPALSEILIVGAVKDVEKSLRVDIEILQNSFQDFLKVNFFLVESHSTDKSLELLELLKCEKSNFDFVHLNENDENEIRTIRLANARNRYLSEIFNNEIYKNIQYLVVADFNALNSDLTRESVLSCWSGNDWDVVTANQSAHYYDIWALRHAIWSPNDCWENLKFLRGHGVRPEKALYAAVQSKMIKIPADSDWIEVDSAFGGLAIYSRNILEGAFYLGVKSDGLPVCEHVPFHATIKLNGGKILINPSLINTKRTDHTIHKNLSHKIQRYLKYPNKIWKSRFLNNP